MAHTTSLSTCATICRSPTHPKQRFAFKPYASDNPSCRSYQRYSPIPRKKDQHKQKRVKPSFPPYSPFCLPLGIIPHQGLPNVYFSPPNFFFTTTAKSFHFTNPQLFFSHLLLIFVFKKQKNDCFPSTRFLSPDIFFVLHQFFLLTPGLTDHSMSVRVNGQSHQ